MPVRKSAIFILAVGGGSVCDYSKAVSVSVHCDDDPWEKYYIRFEEPDCEIVLTNDKHEAIAGFSISTVRHYVSSVYKKTGTQTRLALSKLIENLQKQ